MRREQELSNPESCLNKARDNEWVFVLLGRDLAAVETIRFWCGERIRLGKNQWDDNQIIEAMRCADAMETECGR